MSNSSSLTILHIISDFDGGISSFVKNKATELKDKNIVFNVLTYNKPDERFKSIIEDMGGEIYIIPNPKKESIRKFRAAVKEVYMKQPKNFIIHSHIQGYRVLPLYLMAKKYKPQKFILHAHTDAETNIKNSFMNKLNRYINQSIDVTYSSCGKKATENIFGKINEPVMIIPNSINPHNFSSEIDEYIRNEKRTSELGIDEDTILIGNISRFHKQKNHVFMIDIIEKLAEKNIKFLWIFIGDGELADQIKSKVKELSLEKYVKFLGKRNDVPLLLLLMDYFALPSLYEGLPTVGVESQASGTPTLLSDTITRETDLGLNLVDFISIQDASDWVDVILNNDLQRIKDQNLIHKCLTDKNFTNEESAKLYLDFLNDAVRDYEI